MCMSVYMQTNKYTQTHIQDVVKQPTLNKHNLNYIKPIQSRPIYKTLMTMTHLYTQIRIVLQNSLKVCFKTMMSQVQSYCMAA